MSGLRRLGIRHHCDLVRGSNSCLPKLPPQAGKIKRLVREFHKSLLVSADNTNSKFFFRSSAAISAERKRHLRTAPKYIIHPFSMFCSRWEIVMCVLWLLTFFKDPFTTAFYMNTPKHIHTDGWRIIDLLLDIPILGNIGLCFITGFSKIQTKEVILEPFKIAKHYLITYFFFDFFGSVPFHYVGGLFYSPIKEHEVFFTILACLRFLRFVRIRTSLEFFRRITGIFRLEDTMHQLICLVLLSCYFLHWWACLIFIIPKIQFGLNSNLPNSSWVVMAGIQPELTNVTVGQRYIECMLSAFCHFYRAGVGQYITEEPLEQTMFAMVMITGVFFTSYIIAVVLQMVKSTNASASKYEELVHQLEEYMRKKKLPPHIRQRLILYYENRFQKHYFKEQTILNTLSDHLKYEIFLHSCKGLVDKVALFQGLSKGTVGSIVGCLKHEVFLQNDVIIKAGNAPDCIFFISYGTVAFMLPSGIEVCHYEDGDHFGEIPFFTDAADERRLGNFIALEITEVFKLEKKDLDHCIFQDEEVGEKLERSTAERMAQIEALKKQGVYDEMQHKRDVLSELRRRRILEHTHRTRKRL